MRFTVLGGEVEKAMMLDKIAVSSIHQFKDPHPRSPKFMRQRLPARYKIQCRFHNGIHLGKSIRKFSLITE